MGPPRSESSKSEQAVLWIILAIALVLRVAWALAVEVVPVSDSHAYDTFARNLIEHGVHGWTQDAPSAFWPVGTAAILSAVYWVFGESYAAVVVLNILVSLAVIGMVHALALTWFDRRVAVIAAAVLAVWPSLVMYVTVIASELFFMALVLAGMLAWERGARSRLSLLGAGLAWAGACYVRPLALLLPVALLMGELLRDRTSWRARSLGAAAVLLVMVAALSPWTYRNKVVFGRPVLVSTNFGPTLWMGNNPETTGAYQEPPDWSLSLSEAQRDVELRRAALAHIAEAPARFVVRTVVKLAQLHTRETIAIAWNEVGIEQAFGRRSFGPLKALATGYWYLALLAAIAGLLLLGKRRGLAASLGHPASVGWFYFVGTHAVIIVSDRYHFPAIPFIAILAANSLGALMTRFAEARAPQPVPRA